MTERTDELSKRTMMFILLIVGIVCVTLISVYSMSISKEEIKQNYETQREAEKNNKDNKRTFNFGFGKK